MHPVSWCFHSSIFGKVQVNEAMQSFKKKIRKIQAVLAMVCSVQHKTNKDAGSWKRPGIIFTSKQLLAGSVIALLIITICDYELR